MHLAKPSAAQKENNESCEFGFMSCRHSVCVGGWVGGRQNKQVRLFLVICFI